MKFDHALQKPAEKYPNRRSAMLLFASSEYFLVQAPGSVMTNIVVIFVCHENVRVMLQT
jgi:hypothetical protein